MGGTAPGLIVSPADCLVPSSPASEHSPPRPTEFTDRGNLWRRLLLLHLSVPRLAFLSVLRIRRV